MLNTKLKRDNFNKSIRKVVPKESIMKRIKDQIIIWRLTSMNNNYLKKAQFTKISWYKGHFHF